MRIVFVLERLNNPEMERSQEEVTAGSTWSLQINIATEVHVFYMRKGKR